METVVEVEDEHYMSMTEHPRGPINEIKNSWRKCCEVVDKVELYITAVLLLSTQYLDYLKPRLKWQGCLA
jgi:hypothetical protein